MPLPRCEINSKKPQSQHNLNQKCGFLRLILGCTGQTEPLSFTAPCPPHILHAARCLQLSIPPEFLPQPPTAGSESQAGALSAKSQPST
eukprot:3080519-Rhodomonas_salina.1